MLLSGGRVFVAFLLSYSACEDKCVDIFIAVGFGSPVRYHNYLKFCVCFGCRSSCEYPFSIALFFLLVAAAVACTTHVGFGGKAKHEAKFWSMQGTLLYVSIDMTGPSRLF